MSANPPPNRWENDNPFPFAIEIHKSKQWGDEDKPYNNGEGNASYGIGNSFDQILKMIQDNEYEHISFLGNFSEDPHINSHIAKTLKEALEHNNIATRLLLWTKTRVPSIIMKAISDGLSSSPNIQLDKLHFYGKHDPDHLLICIKDYAFKSISVNFLTDKIFLDIEKFNALKEGLENNKTLTDFSLHNCSGIPIQAIGEALLKNTGLTRLTLLNCQPISDSTAKIFAEGLSKNKMLKYLYIRISGNSNPLINYLAMGLLFNSTLSSLSINLNNPNIDDDEGYFLHLLQSYIKVLERNMTIIELNMTFTITIHRQNIPYTEQESEARAMLETLARQNKTIQKIKARATQAFSDKSHSNIQIKNNASALASNTYSSSSSSSSSSFSSSSSSFPINNPKKEVEVQDSERSQRLIALFDSLWKEITELEEKQYFSKVKIDYIKAVVTDEFRSCLGADESQRLHLSPLPSPFVPGFGNHNHNISPAKPINNENKQKMDIK